MKAQISSQEAKNLVQGLYKSFASPQFIWRKLKSIRNFADIKFFWMAGWKLLGHLMDFSKSKK
jgi:hypothetical protein